MRPRRSPGRLGEAAFALTLAVLLARAFSGQEKAQRPSARESGWTVWTASEMERIGRSDRPLLRSAVSIRAARGEYEGFQIVVSAGVSPVTGVNVEASDLLASDGNSIGRDNLTLYREHYIEVTSPSPDPWRGNRPLGKGWYPDALIPFSDTGKGRRSADELRAAPFDVGQNRNQPVWIDVHVPSDAYAGTYTGTIRVSIQVPGGHQEKTVTVWLRVWNFELPLRPTLKSSFGMHEPNLTDRRVHEVLLRHRIMPESVNPGDARDFQQRFGLNITALRFWGHSSRNTCTMDASPPAPRIAAALRLYPADLPVYMYPADEIDPCPNLFSTVRDWAAAMHIADARVSNLVTVAPKPALYDDGRGAGRPAVDIWTLLPKAWESDGPAIREVQARGQEVWSYNALVQDPYSPKWEIDFAPVNYRIQPGFLSQSLGITGLLYWRVDLWTASPFEDLRGYTIDGNFYPGEGMLVYPGQPAGFDTILPSMRLKWIREGVEDFEYVAILKRLGRGEWALQRARRVGADWREWTRDIRALEAVREELGDEIERLASAQPSANAPR